MMDGNRHGKYDNWPDEKVKENLEGGKISFDNFTKITRQDIYDIIDDRRFAESYSKTKKIKDMANTYNEIMLHCKDVYLLKYDYKQDYFEQTLERSL